MPESIYNDCDKHGDPFGYAAQEFFTNFVEAPNKKGKAGLTHIVSKVIEDFPDSEYEEELEDILDRAINVETQREVIDIVDELIQIAIGLGLSEH